MGLVLNAPINDLGYGVVGTQLAIELSKRRPLYILPIGPITPSVEHNLTFSQEKDIPPCTSLMVYHQHALNHIPQTTNKIGWPIFELNQFMQEECECLRRQDGLIVCSHWAAEVMAAYGLKSFVVPLGYDPSVFFPAKSADGPVRFFNIGKWEIRKGHDFLHRAWSNAFDSDKYRGKVELHMCCDNPFLNQYDHQKWYKLYSREDIKIHNRFKNHLDVANFIRSMDVGVFPSRAEGWNLEALETLACGKHLIITDYSAHKDFAEENLITIDGLERAVDGIWFYGQGEWASLRDNQMEQTVYHLRNLAERVDHNINNHSVRIAEKFTWEKVVDRLEGVLNVLDGRKAE